MKQQFCCVVSFFFLVSTHLFAGGTEIDSKQLAQQVNNYCTQVRAELNGQTFPLSINGFSALESALTNEDFIETACASFNNGKIYQRCSVGAFSLKNELAGLKNAIKIYNETQSKYTMYMISNDLSYVQTYLQNLL